MVSTGVPPPVVKLVEETAAVQPAPKPRSSVTATMPRFAWMVPPGGPAPRPALAGAVIDSGPAMTATMAVHWAPPPPAGQSLPAAVEAAVLVIVVDPVSGLLT